MTAQKPENWTSRTQPPSPHCCCGPDNPRACFVFAHGAGAGMSHPFMETVAAGPVASAEITTLALPVPPIWEKGSKRPDAPAVAHAAVRAAGRGSRAMLCRTAADRGRKKSFGGPYDLAGRRRSRRCPAFVDWPFWGFPLHPADKAIDDARAAHPFRHQYPDVVPCKAHAMRLAEMTLLEARRGKTSAGLASLHVVAGGAIIPLPRGRRGRDGTTGR